MVIKVARLNIIVGDLGSVVKKKGIIGSDKMDIDSAYQGT
jgi:hypothetical protein